MHVLSRFPSSPGSLFGNLLRQFNNCVLILDLHRSLSRSASVKPYLENVRPTAINHLIYTHFKVLGVWFLDCINTFSARASG